MGVKVSQGVGQPLYLCGEVESSGKRHKIDFELDTGADRSIISRFEAERLGVKIREFNRSKPIIGVGGKRIQCRFFCIIRLELKDLNGEYLKFNILVYIFDGSLPNLFGNDIMLFMKAIISFKKKTIELNGRIFQVSNKKQVIQSIKNVKTGDLKVILPMEVCLPPKVVKQVKVSLSGDFGTGRLVLVGHGTGEWQFLDVAYGYKVKPGDFTMVVFNLTDKNVVLKRGLEVGYVLVENDWDEMICISELINDPAYFTKDGVDDKVMSDEFKDRGEGQKQGKGRDRRKGKKSRRSVRKGARKKGKEEREKEGEGEKEE